VRAVDGVDFTIYENETLGVVGESGCGKSTLGRLLVRLLDPTSGKISFKQRNIFAMNASDKMEFRREVQMIFQNPFASLNPRKTIRQILQQPFVVHKVIDKSELYSRISELLGTVGLTPAESFLDRYPHELSGGQRQRLVICRAIALRPRFIVADEPVSALDVSIRSQILNLLRRLQREFNLTQMFITHDLGVARAMCSRTAVMYLGRIVELGPDELYQNPLHPYSKALLSAAPYPHPETRKRSRIILSGEVPSPTDPPKGCRFHPRCKFSMPECASVEPNLVEVAHNHLVACHLHRKSSR